MKKNKILFVPPLLFAGILLVLLPIFTFMTMERLERQDEFITQKMIERGMALIRTFEAGTRTGMFTMRWGAGRIQTMLQETAYQPEIEYIMIVSRDGKIMAHSDPAQVGQIFKDMPQIGSEGIENSAGYHRIVKPANAIPIFEVYKQFVPIQKTFKHKNRPMRRGQELILDNDMDRPDKTNDPGDWSRQYMANGEEPVIKIPEHYIFAGLSMEKGQALRNRLLRETVFRTIVLFLLGCAGMLALFAFQAYRSTRASLVSMKAFSDNVIQNMPTGLVTIDLNHDITFMNHAARKLFGQYLARPYPEWIELIKQIESSRPVINQEINLGKEGNKMIRLEVIASPVKEGDDQITGFLFLFRDLSQIRELQKQVETNNRLAAIGKLAAGVAHEIRNPLSSIKGFATYFSKRYAENETDHQTAEIMKGEVERINRSITQLLEFAKPLSIERKQVDIKALIDHSLRLVQHDLEQKKIQTRLEIQTQRKMITTDPDRMNQVFLNLYINAIEALSANGCLDIMVTDSVRDSQIKIQVKDNGIGIEEGAMDRIFDPYYTTRSAGTGLGLAIVHTIIENLGGQIHVESQKGQGACFTILLPMV
ncbi:MAG: ATP-binding protein [Pseudomonadota bacterium]